jgi:hypothetical protein
MKTGAEIGIIKTIVLGQNNPIEEPKIKPVRTRKKAS